MGRPRLIAIQRGAAAQTRIYFRNAAGYDSRGRGMLKEKSADGASLARELPAVAEFQIIKVLKNLIKVDKAKVETQFCFMLNKGASRMR